jgi:hypothetical protein
VKPELIKIAEFQKRAWGENGTPLCSQAIRNHIKNDDLPGKKIGKLFFIDWSAYKKLTGDSLVDAVLRKAS